MYVCGPLPLDSLFLYFDLILSGSFILVLLSWFVFLSCISTDVQPASVQRSLYISQTSQDVQPHGQRKAAEQSGQHHHTGGQHTFMSHILCHHEAAHGGR